MAAFLFLNSGQKEERGEEVANKFINEALSHTVSCILFVKKLSDSTVVVSKLDSTQITTHDTGLM